MALDQLGLYNDAFLLLGERPITALTDSDEPRLRADAVWNFGAVRFCLEVVKPSFASIVAPLTVSLPSASTSFTNVFTLPVDWIATVRVFGDPELTQEINQYITDGQTISCNYPAIWVRYVSNTLEPLYARWTQSFARVVSAYIARELTTRFDSDKLAEIDATFNQRVKAALKLDSQNEPSSRTNPSNATLAPAHYALYNDALQLLGIERLATPTDDSRERAALDVAMGSSLVEAALEDTGWAWARQTTQISYDPSLTPLWGHQYVFTRPADFRRLVGIYTDETLTNRLQVYKSESNRFYADWQVLYLEYVSDAVLGQPDSWPASFKRYVASYLAKDISGILVTDRNVMNRLDREHEIRRKGAIGNDVVNQPPQILRAGSWSQARRNTNGRGRNGRGY